MKKTGIFGTLVFNHHKIDNEKFPVYFEEAIPDTVSVNEDRNWERVLIDMEMDGYITRLRVSSNGDISVSIGKKLDWEEQKTT